jgi:hypothetical protein
MRVATVLSPVREFFLLEAARKTIEGYSVEQHRRVQSLRAAGDNRLSAARRASSQVAACSLLREAVTAYALARAVAADAHATDEATIQAQLDVPELPPDPLDGDAGDSARVREALAARDPFYVDELEAAARARLQRALDRAASALRRRVEARSVVHVRALRWGRLLAPVVLVLYVAWVGVRHRFVPANVAIGKPVKVSSYKENPPDGHELAEGKPGFTFTVATKVEDSPNVVIDLLDDYAIDRVAVYNRADGWWDDCLPLVVELSRDGKTFVELARRDTFFGFTTPWVAPASGRMARYVRVRVARKSSLVLGRVEVFGNKP